MVALLVAAAVDSYNMMVENNRLIEQYKEITEENTSLKKEVKTIKTNLEKAESLAVKRKEESLVLKADVERLEKELEQERNKNATTVNQSSFGSFKSYTDYRLLSKSSKQWQLQEKAYTDENGLRKIGDAYLVAMGSYYGTNLGAKYRVVMESGIEFYVILCDCKNDIHTDSNNQVCLVNGSVLEFYVDSDVLPNSVSVSGSVGAIPMFSGSINSIQQIA